MTGKHGIEGGGLARVGTDRFHTHTENIALARQKRHAIRMKAGRVRFASKSLSFAEKFARICNAIGLRLRFYIAS